MLTFGPVNSKDHFQSPRHLILMEPGTVIQGFIMNSGHKSSRGSFSLERGKFVETVPGLFNLRLFFPMRIESTSRRVCSRVSRSGIILDTDSWSEEPGSLAISS